MAQIRDWLMGFLSRHRARFAPHDWPSAGMLPGSEASEENRVFLLAWQGAFAAMGVSEAEAEAASQRLTMSPPRFRKDHIPDVIEAVKAIRRETSAGTTDTPEGARAASRECHICGGMGLAMLGYGRERHGEIVKATCAGHCTCALGRWMRGKCDADNLRGIPDLGSLPWGMSLLNPPDPRDEPPARTLRETIQPRRVPVEAA